MFLCDEDRSLFLDTIGEWGERFAIELFSYGLMSTHYHLLLRTRRANLSRAMQLFAGTYMRRFDNRTYSTELTRSVPGFARRRGC